MDCRHRYRQALVGWRRARDDRHHPRGQERGGDAALIAAATAQVDAVKAPPDPRLRRLAERLTAYEQITDQAAELKGFMAHVTLADVIRSLNAQIRSLERPKVKLAAEVIKLIKAHEDLLGRTSA